MKDVQETGTLERFSYDDGVVKKLDRKSVV
jgi:hypothetical protein